MQTARDLMRRNVIAVSPETSNKDAIDRLVENDVSGMPVVDSAGRVVGVLSELDQIQRGAMADQSVRELMTTQVVTVDVEDSVLDVVHTFRDNSVRWVPVTENGVMVGIICVRDLVRWIRGTESMLQQISSVFRGSELFEAKPFESEYWCNAD